MQVTVIPIVIGALCTVTKGLILEPEDLEIGRVEGYSNYSFIKIGENTKRVLETRGDLLSLKLQW